MRACPVFSTCLVEASVQSVVVVEQRQHHANTPSTYLLAASSVWLNVNVACLRFQVFEEEPKR